VIGMSVRRYHLDRRAVGPEHLAVMWALVAPGAVAAGASIALPDYARPARRLIDALLLKTAAGSAVHAACAATGAVYAAAANLLSPAGEALVTETKKLAVVETTPAAGQIQLVGDDKVVLGEDTAADDVLVVIVELRP